MLVYCAGAATMMRHMLGGTSIMRRFGMSGIQHAHGRQCKLIANAMYAFFF